MKDVSFLKFTNARASVRVIGTSHQPLDRALLISWIALASQSASFKDWIAWIGITIEGEH